VSISLDYVFWFTGKQQFLSLLVERIRNPQI